MRPTGDRLNCTELELTLFNVAPADFDPSKYKFDTSQEYKITSLQLFTKATSLCKNVEIFISDDFPLIVQYLIGDLGTLRFLLASRILDATWDDDEEDQHEPAAAASRNEPPIAGTDVMAVVARGPAKRGVELRPRVEEVPPKRGKFE